MRTQWVRTDTIDSYPALATPMTPASAGSVGTRGDPRAKIMSLDRIDRDSSRRENRHMAETMYPPNPDCEAPSGRDDVAAEATSVARIATVRAMNFAGSPVGSAAMRGAGDGYLDVVREYVNSALAQRCNPLRIHDIGHALRGVDAVGDGLSISGDAKQTKISVTRHGVDEPNRFVNMTSNGLTADRERQKNGSYSPSIPFNSAAANYPMRYHGRLSTDWSMVP